MANLFERTGLEQDTGLLRERWGQQGSNIVNISGNYSADGTIYTVTSNKTLYIVSLAVTNENATSGRWGLRDGGAAGDLLFLHTDQAAVGTGSNITFSTPLRFETDIYFDEDVATDVDLTLTGWEE